MACPEIPVMKPFSVIVGYAATGVDAVSSPKYAGSPPQKA
jgi:hypothetical protein